MDKKVAIYHYTNDSTKRPIVYKKQMDVLRNFATRPEWIITKEFIDYSLLKCEQEQFKQFLGEKDKYNILIVKDFYHITRNTRACFCLMKELIDAGIEIHTLENGTFKVEEPPYDLPLRVATYNCRFIEESNKNPMLVQNEVFKLFVENKTNWKIIDQYIDESKRKLDCEQIKLRELINNKDKYDMILLKNFNDLHWRTSKFLKTRNKLGIDIFAIQDGFFKFRKNYDISKINI